MSLSQKAVEDFQRVFKEQYGEDMNYEEAEEAGTRLVELYSILFKFKVEEERMKMKLKGNPKGYELENKGGRQCLICRQSPDPLWYDRYGQKCITCQKAIENGDVPGYVCRNRESWYSVFDFDYYFHMKSQTVRKLERNGVLNARIVKANGSNYQYVFLLEENKGILPSKKLLKGTSARMSENPDLITLINWYEYQDPKEVLADYGILEHIKAFEDWKPKYIAKQ